MIGAKRPPSPHVSASSLLQSVRTLFGGKERRGGARAIGVVRQWFGTGGAESGASGAGWRTFLYSFAAIAVIVGSVNIINVLTIRHEEPALGVAAPIVWEGSSWLTVLASLWIPWLAYRFAPPRGRPRLKLLVHAPAVLAFSIAHVGGFIVLRELAYVLAGHHYTYGTTLAHFLYEFQKDVFDYALDITIFALLDHLLRQQHRIPGHAAVSTFSIRDGARILRVKVADILAISSAGNYVEFSLRDGRKPLMRSPLSAVEEEFAPHGFVRVHRSWLVNPARMTALKPEGSGDYTVELGELSVPLSRRFPEALARLRAA